jgi:hypothetical protein
MSELLPVRRRYSSCGRGCAPQLLMRAVTPPAPPTSILMVPFGPKLVFMTSCRPLAALMFMNRAALLPMISAFGLSVFTDPMLELVGLIAAPKRKRATYSIGVQARASGTSRHCRATYRRFSVNGWDCDWSCGARCVLCSLCVPAKPRP